MGRDEWITGGMTRVSVTAGVLFHSSLPSPPHPFSTSVGSTSRHLRSVRRNE